MFLRMLSLLAVALGAALLCLAAGTVKLQRDTHDARVQEALLARGDEQSADLSAYLQQIEAVVGSVAAVPAVQRTAAGAATEQDRADALAAILNLHRTYAGATGEALLLDAHGTIAIDTVAGRERSRTGSPDLQPGRTAPYRSRAVGVWVVGYGVPVAGADDAQGTLFLETTLQSLGWWLLKGGTEAVQVVDRATGRVLVDSDDPRYDSRPLTRLDPGELAAIRAASEPSGVVHGSHGRLLSFRRLPTAGPRTDWVVLSPAVVEAVSLAGVTTLPLGFAAIGGILLMVGVAGLGRARRSLELIAHTDALTGLYNRRALDRDLAARTAGPRSAQSVGVVVFDLDGFKIYNDTFGHPAGDALLMRLGHALRNAAQPGERAYRLGGDEFCVLTSPAATTGAIKRGSDALSEQGEGFEITSSWGAALLPEEAQTSSEALRVADDRLYARKSDRGGSTGRQLSDALLVILGERSFDLGPHGRQVADLAEDIGRKLGLAEGDLVTLHHAARLHDIGKLAIPESILTKPSPLDPEEWSFIRRHTLIGERVLAAAPALASAATFVRSHHEHWDGSGYPDGLVGEAIPLAARILAACDAFDAMRSARAYRTALTFDQAVAELRAGAGTQFDPAVVDAFLEAVFEAEEEEAFVA